MFGAGPHKKYIVNVPGQLSRLPCLKSGTGYVVELPVSGGAVCHDGGVGGGGCWYVDDESVSRALLLAITRCVDRRAVGLGRVRGAWPRGGTG